MHVHEFFDLSITVGTGVTLFLIMQFLGYAVVQYLNREGTACSRDRKGRRSAPPSSRSARAINGQELFMLGNT